MVKYQSRFAIVFTAYSAMHGNCKMHINTSSQISPRKALIYCLRYVIACLLLTACGTSRNYSGALRGDTILYLRFPIANGREEGMTLNKNRTASRSFSPVTGPTEINQATAPEPLWSDLENLRQRWCAQAPSAASRTPDDAAFEVVFQCHELPGLPNPVYFVRASELPEPLRALIDLVPLTRDD
jgi:hypothetical protein